MHLRRRHPDRQDTAEDDGVIVRTAMCLSIVILAGTGGELLAAHAMKQSARLQVTSGSAVAMLLQGGFRLSAMWVGVMLQGVAFFTLLALLSWADVSFVVPATALNYVVGAAGSMIFFREQVDRTRWTGVLLVCLGVAFICASGL
jgi:drug/metabolite transporter (DMT)-like permease